MTVDHVQIGLQNWPYSLVCVWTTLHVGAFEFEGVQFSLTCSCQSHELDKYQRIDLLYLFPLNTLLSNGQMTLVQSFGWTVAMLLHRFQSNRLQLRDCRHLGAQRNRLRSILNLPWLPWNWGLGTPKMIFWFYKFTGLMSFLFSMNAWWTAGMKIELGFISWFSPFEICRIENRLLAGCSCHAPLQPASTIPFCQACMTCVGYHRHA